MAHFTETSNEEELGWVTVRREKKSVNPKCKVYVSPVLRESLELIVIVNEFSAFFTTAVNPAGGVCGPVDVKDSMAEFIQFEGVIVQAEEGKVRVVVLPI